MCYLPLFFLIKKRDKLFASGIIYSQEIRQGQKEVGYLIYWFVYWVEYRIWENEEAKTSIFFIFVSETVIAWLSNIKKFF